MTKFETRLLIGVALFTFIGLTISMLRLPEDLRGGMHSRLEEFQQNNDTRFLDLQKENKSIKVFLKWLVEMDKAQKRRIKNLEEMLGLQ